MQEQERTIEKKQKFLEKFEECYGIISIACKYADINRSTYYDWIKSDSAFKQQCDDIIEARIDIMESELIKNVNNGKEASIFFALKTIGKHRGYIERQEVHDITPSQTISKIVVHKDDGTSFELEENDL